MKTCITCKRLKEASKFHKKKDAKDGLKSSCVVCCLGYGRKHYKLNKKKILMKQQEYYLENKEKILTRCFTYYISNKEKILTRCNNYYATNREGILAYRHQHYLNNTEIINARNRKYAVTNKNTMNAIAARYRATKLNQTPPDADMKKIGVFYAEATRLSKETGIRHDVDHIIPISKGGLHHQGNLQVLTKTENCSKGAKLPNELLKNF